MLGNDVKISAKNVCHNNSTFIRIVGLWQRLFTGTHPPKAECKYWHILLQYNGPFWFTTGSPFTPTQWIHNKARATNQISLDMLTKVKSI